MRNSFIVLLPLVGLLNAGAHAETRVTRYDANGRYEGYVQRDGSRVVEHDRNGMITGWSTKDGDQIKYYDANGVLVRSERISR